MTKLRIILTCLLATFSSGQLISCSGLSPENKTLYAPDVGNSTAAPRGPSLAQPGSLVPSSISRDQTLQVRRVNISPPCDGLSLIYRTRGGTYVKDYYNEWAVPPEELFSSQLVDFLSASGAFASVVDGRSAALHRYALETCITSLYGDFQDPRHPKVVLDARVYLIDDSAGDRRVAYQNHYDITIPLAGASAEQLVRGAGRAYRQILESLTQDLSPFNKTAVAGDGR
jgi:cholesterol transport system auxiliary component